MPQEKTSRSSRALHYEATQDVMEWAQEVFGLYRDRRSKCELGPMGFAYVETPLGTIEIPIDLLLYQTARMLAVCRGEKPAAVIKITYEAVDASIDVLHKIPAYVMCDFSGMIMEADFDLHALRQNLKVGWKDVSGNLKGAKNGSVNLELLRTMLDKWGVGTLEIDDAREAFERIFSKAGEVGPMAWEKILQGYIRKKRRPGRPRNTNYDSLFERRISNPRIETYGKLMRQLPDAATVPGDVVRNRLKSAISYRRKGSQKI